MNRITRLSLIATMLLSTTVLGVLGYHAMYPELPPSVPPPEAKSEPPKPKEPKPNPYYQELQANLDRHERYCLQLGKESTIVLSNQNQNESRAKDCWNLVKLEREYVTNYPTKTIID